MNEKQIDFDIFLDPRKDLCVTFRGKEISFNIPEYSCIHGINGSGKTELGIALGEREDCYYHNCLCSHIGDFDHLVQTYYRKTDLFKKYIKEVMTDKKLLSIHPFVFEDKNGNDIKFQYLGSGEKSLIIILAVLAFRPEEVIIFDLPETHIHVSVQSRLVEFFIQTDKFVISLTHSPSMIGIYYKNAINIEKLLNAEELLIL